MHVIKRTSNRITYVDAFKGIGIILMIMGHISFGELFSKFIHAFHMPLFFIASGYLYKKMPVGGVIYKRIKRFILPYILVGFFHYILAFLIFPERDHMIMLKNLLLVNTNSYCRGIVVFNFGIFCIYFF